MIEVFAYIFYVCIGLGLAVPLLSVIFGLFGSLINADFDFGAAPGDFNLEGSVDAGNAIPINIMCICFSLAVFGALGRLFLPLMTGVFIPILILAALLALSICAYILIYKYIVKPLQKNDPRALGHWDLFGTKGRLTLRITVGSPGTVSLKDSTGAIISYRATARQDILDAWDGVIPQGAEVIVVDLDDSAKMAYIKPLNTFENHNLKQKSE